MNKTFSILCLMIIFCSCSQKMSADIRVSKSQIKKELNEYFQDYDAIDFNGSILISINNKIILKDDYGYVDYEKSKLLEKTSTYNIGSVYKEFTSFAVLNLIEEGKLAYNTKLSEVFEKLPNWSDKITIKDLLFYTSGLPRMTFHKEFGDTDVLNDLKKIDKLLFEPGKEFFYSNLNNFLQGKVVEEITGEKLSEYVKTNLFDAQKMRDSKYTSFPPVFEDNMTRSYSKEWGDDILKNPKVKKFELCFGPVYMTTMDLYKWSKFVYKKYNKQSEIIEEFYKKPNMNLEAQ